MNDDEAFLQKMEEESRERQQRLRTELIARGRFDVLDGYDAAMRDLDLGITGARNCWHSISEAQRRALTVAGERASLGRESASSWWYGAAGEPHYLSRVANVKTVRNLAARELLYWDGGVFDPERCARITERGRFVLKHGPVVAQGNVST